MVLKSKTQNHRVFVRARPLSKEELLNDDVRLVLQHQEETNRTTTLELTAPKTEGDDVEYVEVLGFTVPKSKPNRNKKFRKFTGYHDEDVGNEQVYATSVAPLVKQVLEGNTACCFAYGHTGSGKTHTILGYGDEVGMYAQAAGEIMQAFGELKSQHNDEKIKLQVRFSEVYNGEVFDLLNNNEKCFVREDAHGKIHIRRETQVTEDGDVVSGHIESEFAETEEQLKEIVAQGLSSRSVGRSNVHEHSSRSHAILEMEIVTDKLLALRTALDSKQILLTKLGKNRDDIEVLVHRNMYEKDDFGKWKLRKDARGATSEQVDELQVLKREISVLEREIEQIKENIQEELSSSNACVGGTMVFVDLAGAEHAGKGGANEIEKTVQEQNECREINKSLLALKQCISSLSRGMTRGPYRDSKLTMILRDHLRLKKSKTTMICTISPSESHMENTIHTLRYAQIVAGC